MNRCEERRTNDRFRLNFFIKLINNQFHLLLKAHVSIKRRFVSRMIGRFAFFFFVFCLHALANLRPCDSARPFNPIVRATNVTQAMEKDAVRICKTAFEKFGGYSKTTRASMAQAIRQQFDRLHGPSWQCILGLDYALSITSENERRILLDVDKVSILIFKGKC